MIDKKLLAFLIAMATYGTIRLIMAFVPVAASGVICATSEPIEYEGTATYMCDDFAGYALMDIMTRLFFF